MRLRPILLNYLQMMFVECRLQAHCPLSRPHRWQTMKNSYLSAAQRRAPRIPEDHWAREAVTVVCSLSPVLRNLVCHKACTSDPYAPPCHRGTPHPPGMQTSQAQHWGIPSVGLLYTSSSQSSGSRNRQACLQFHRTKLLGNRHVLPPICGIPRTWIALITFRSVLVGRVLYYNVFMLVRGWLMRGKPSLKQSFVDAETKTSGYADPTAGSADSRKSE